MLTAKSRKIDSSIKMLLSMTNGHNHLHHFVGFNTFLFQYKHVITIKKHTIRTCKDNV